MEDMDEILKSKTALSVLQEIYVCDLGFVTDKQKTEAENQMLKKGLDLNYIKSLKKNEYNPYDYGKLKY